MIVGVKSIDAVELEPGDYFFLGFQQLWLSRRELRSDGNLTMWFEPQSIPGEIKRLNVVPERHVLLQIPLLFANRLVELDEKKAITRTYWESGFESGRYRGL